MGCWKGMYSAACHAHARQYEREQREKKRLKKERLQAMKRYLKAIIVRFSDPKWALLKLKDRDLYV